MLEIRNQSGKILQIIENNFVLTRRINDFESPEFVGASYTSSIQAFATDENRQFFGFSDALHVETNITNEKIFVNVKWNGIEIDNMAYILLQSFDDEKFIFNLFFSQSSFGGLLGEKTLKNLDLGSVSYQVSTMNFNNTALDYINPIFFMGSRNKKAWYERVFCWKLSALLNKIIEEAGYSLDPLPPACSWLNNTYLVPTPELFDFEEQFQNEKKQFEGFQRLSNDVNIVASNSFSLLVNFDVVEGNSNFFKNTYYAMITGYVYHIKFSLTFVRNSAAFPPATIPYIALGYVTDINNPLSSFYPFHTSIEVPLQHQQQEYKIEYTITVAAAEFPIIKRVYLRISQPVSNRNTNWTLKAGSYMQVTVAEYIPEGLFTYNHAANLPAIGQREFLKQVLYLSGCSMKVDNYEKKITIQTIQEVIDATDNVIDFTNYIDFSEPININYRNNLAQNNRIKFKDSEEGSISFQLSDTNLPLSRDISLSFQKASNLQTAPPALLADIRNFKDAEIIAPRDASDSSPAFDVNCPSLFCTTVKKKLDFICGTLTDVGNLVETITRTPRNTVSNTVVARNGDVNNLVFVRADNWQVPSGSKYLQAFDNLAAFANNFSYVQNLYEGFRKVIFKAYLPATIVFSSLTDKKILIRANVNRLFLLQSINNYQSPDLLCDVELLMIK